jgi:hypothetical protein
VSVNNNTANAAHGGKTQITSSKMSAKAMLPKRVLSFQVLSYLKHLIIAKINSGVN